MRRLNRSVRRILGLLYPFPGMITIADRNVLIKQRFEEGEALTDIAVDFDISPQRVWQIVRGKDRS
jgi:Mor family transcriptional regulator